MAKNPNVIKKAALVQEIVKKLYEKGNQRRSKVQAFRRHVKYLHPMSERTFWRLVNMDTEKEEAKLREINCELCLFKESCCDQKCSTKKPL